MKGGEEVNFWRKGCAAARRPMTLLLRMATHRQFAMHIIKFECFTDFRMFGEKKTIPFLYCFHVHCIVFMYTDYFFNMFNI